MSAQAHTIATGKALLDGTRRSPNRQALWFSLWRSATSPDGTSKATCRFSHRSEIGFGELPLPQVLGSARTLRAEEIVISVPDGPNVTALANMTLNRSVGGEVESVIVTRQDLAPLQELEGCGRTSAAW